MKRTLSILAVTITFLAVFQTGALAATKCQNLGDSKTIKGVTQVCARVGNSKIWQVQKKIVKPTPQLSDADLNVKTGCSLFWTNIDLYRKSSQASGRGDGRILQELNGYFLNAQLSDTKYVPLYNAFYLIMLVVQGLPSDASKYDKQQAAALFNSYCNTGLEIS